MRDNSPSKLSDEELREALNSKGVDAGPIGPSTRKIYEKKLINLMKNEKAEDSTKATKATKTSRTPSPARRTKPAPSAPAKTLPAVASKAKPIPVIQPATSSKYVPRTSLSSSFNRSSTSTSSFGQGDNDLSSLLGDDQTSSRIIPQSPPIARYPLYSTGTKSLFSKASPISNFDRTATLSFGQDDDLDEDDHMESSRILSPASRFKPSPTSATKFSAGRSKGSPIEQITKFGRTAWGYFSRPIGQSTPCSDDKYKQGTADISQRNVRYSPLQKYRRSSFVDPNAKRGFSLDVSRWMVVSFALFIAVLLIGYMSSSHPETVKNVASTMFDVAKTTVNFFYSYAVVPSIAVVLVVLAVAGVYQAYKFYKQKKTDTNKRLMALVERITDIIHDSRDGIAEPHVRDMLMPPTKRTEEDYKLWSRAAEFINTEDSRIRTEIRLINGIECNVWIWVPQNRQMWQGTAVAEGSPSANIPSKALTRCLKLRGLNFSNNLKEQGELRNALIKKIKPVLPVHVGFKSEPQESVVYMKLKSLEEANKAFVSLHSHWFNDSPSGGLVTAKYVHDNRYNERFPDA